MNTADACIHAKCRSDCIKYPRFAMAEQPRGVVAEHVDVVVAIGISQPRLVTRNEREWVWGVSEHGSGVATREILTGLVVVLATLRISISEIVARLSETLVGHADTLGKRKTPPGFPGGVFLY